MEKQSLPAQFETDGLLESHMESNHDIQNHSTPPASIECSKCEEILDSRIDLQKHLESKHNNSDGKNKAMFSCDFCDIKFELQDHLTEHLETMHTTEFINCNHCKYRCRSRTHLKEHMMAHHSSQAFITPQDQPQSPSALLSPTPPPPVETAADRGSSSL